MKGDEKGVKQLQQRIERELRAIAFQHPADYLECCVDEEGKARWQQKPFERLTPRAKRAIERVEIKRDGSMEYRLFSKFKAFEMLQKLYASRAEEAETKLSEGDRELLRKVSRRCGQDD